MMSPSRILGRLPARRPLVAPVLLALLLGGSAGAEDAPSPRLSELGEQALARLDAGDLDGALELLVPATAPGELSLVDRALLGALYLEAGRPADSLKVLLPLAVEQAADPAVVFNAYRAAAATGRAALAERLLERAAELAPVSPAARELGLVRGAHGETAEAYRLLRGWVLAQPDDLEARLAAGAAALRLGRTAEATRLLAGVPDEDPGVRLLLGQLALQQGDARGAVERLEPLLAEHPPAMELDLVRLTADAYIQVGRAGEAAALLADKGSADPRLALLLAEARYRTGDLAGALAALEPSARPVLGSAPEEPLSFQLALDYGRMLVAAGRSGEALPYLELASRLQPENGLAWKALGDALAASGRRPEAEQALQRFRDLGAGEADRRRQAEPAASDPVSAALRAAEQALQAGRPERALGLLRQEVALSPDDLRLRLALVRLLLHLERREEALGAAEAALGLFPEHPDAHYQRGVARAALEDHRAAEEDLRRVLELAPDHTAALNDLAVLLLLDGRTAEARQLLERALAINPQDPVAARNLADLPPQGDP